MNSLPLDHTLTPDMLLSAPRKCGGPRPLVSRTEPRPGSPTHPVRETQDTQATDEPAPQRQPRRRRPNRQHLSHRVILRLRERGDWFDIHEVCRLIYFGREIHPQQRLRVRDLLMAYVDAGLLTVRRDEQRGYLFRWEPVAEPSPEQLSRQRRLKAWWPPKLGGEQDQVMTFINFYLDGLL